VNVSHTDVLISPDDPDALVPVAAGELFEWAWLADELADWLAHAADTTAFDMRRYFPAGPPATRDAGFPFAEAPEEGATMRGHVPTPTWSREADTRTTRLARGARQ